MFLKNARLIPKSLNTDLSPAPADQPYYVNQLYKSGGGAGQSNRMKSYCEHFFDDKEHMNAPFTAV